MVSRHLGTHKACATYNDFHRITRLSDQRHGLLIGPGFHINTSDAFNYVIQFQVACLSMFVRQQLHTFTLAHAPNQSHIHRVSEGSS